jgi:hypothetical protein
MYQHDLCKFVQYSNWGQGTNFSASQQARAHKVAQRAYLRTPVSHVGVRAMEITTKPAGN